MQTGFDQMDFISVSAFSYLHWTMLDVFSASIAIFANLCFINFVFLSVVWLRKRNLQEDWSYKMFFFKENFFFFLRVKIYVQYFSVAVIVVFVVKFCFLIGLLSGWSVLWLGSVGFPSIRRFNNFYSRRTNTVSTARSSLL